MFAEKIKVVDYSLDGRWVIIGYPGGRIMLPRGELSSVPSEYASHVLNKAMAVTARNRERFAKSWQYSFVELDHRRRFMTYEVELKIKTRGRTLSSKILKATFLVTMTWWMLPDGSLHVEEWDRQKVSMTSSDHTVYVDAEHIPRDVIDRIAAATELYLTS